MWARVMPTMSSLPSAMAWRAVATSVDAGGMEDREFGRGPDLAGEIEMRRRAHAGDRDHVGQRRVMLDMTADDVEEVELAGCRPAGGRSRCPSSLERPLSQILVRHHADADDEVGADRLAHRIDAPAGEAQAVVERAVVLVVAVVGRRRPEAVHQMAVGFELDAVEAGRLHALRGGGIVGDDAVDVPVLHLLGKRRDGPARAPARAQAPAASRPCSSWCGGRDG